MPVAVALAVVGVALVTVLGPFDGFLGGMASGAGVALVLLGVAVLGRADRLLASGDEGWWLPSRDPETGQDHGEQP